MCSITFLPNVSFYYQHKLSSIEYRSGGLFVYECTISKRYKAVTLIMLIESPLSAQSEGVRHKSFGKK